MPLGPGTLLGPYEILAAIGAGGMGEVYKAHDTRLRRDVAIKVLQQVVADGAAWERFQREARAASALSHPNICTVHDVGEADGQPYLVMELLEGVTLRAHIGEKALETNAAVAIAVQIADALEAAHKKGIIHRDIKPANVMITGRGHVKVLDFGLAKQTAIDEDQPTLTLESLSAVGTVMGTPQYISPEVLQGARADARSDLWAFGVVLYQMLSGRLPFTGTTMLEMSSSILKEPAPPLTASVPTGLRAIVERCLARPLGDRYQNAGEVRAALELLYTRAGPASGSSRRTWLWAAGAAAVLAAGVFIWQQQPDSIAGGRRLSSGGPASSVQEANELFELSMNLMRVQNDVPRAMATLERAMALDGHFAEARRYHAFAYLILLLNGYTNDSNVLYKAEEELRQVAQEAPDLESLPSAQAAVYAAQGRKELIPYEKLNRVIERNPRNNDAQVWRLILLSYAGENEQAKQIATEMLEREPLFGAPRMFLGDMRRREGDIPGAIREELKVLEQAPTNISAARYLALAYMDAGDLSQARRVLEEKRSLYSENYMWRHSWALLLAVEGKREEALRTMDAETLKFLDAAFVVTSEAAEFYAVLGDTATAVEWLDRAVRHGDERVEWFRKDPRLASIQKDERFLRIVESIEARRKR